MKGRYAEAEATFRKAIKTDPAYDDAYSMLGDALYMQGKYDESLDWLLKAKALQPDDRITRFKLGKTYLKLGMPAKACIEFEFYKSALVKKGIFSGARKRLFEKYYRRCQ